MKKVLLILLAVFIFTGCESKAQETDYIPARTQTNPNSDTIEITVVESNNEETTKFNETTESAATNPIVDTNETKTPDFEEPIEDKISGIYYCESDYCNNDLIILRRPECKPYIAFYENSYCVFHVNYAEGLCDFEGTYKIEDNVINVKLDLSENPFGGINVATGNPYMDDEFTFEIIDNNHIKIGPGPDSFYGGDCYTVNNGDPFIRK